MHGVGFATISSLIAGSKQARSVRGGQGMDSFMVGLQVLASGSAANCSVVGDGNSSLLIDIGLGVREMQTRLTSAGIETSSIKAAVLTHTHTDHWNPASLNWLAKHGARLWCHAAHVDQISPSTKGLQSLLSQGLVSFFHDGTPFRPIPSWTFTPIRVSHDAEPTFGFRFEREAVTARKKVAMAYLADLGTATESLPWDLLHDLDGLALESNHDPDMLESSNRPHHLIRRIRGNSGHLSNQQCGEAAARFAKQSSGRLKSVILLHLSRECNTAQLAGEASSEALKGLVDPRQIGVAVQNAPSKALRFTQSR
jgi:phosphoribosyl 1,2-cyclic phosphodiesterase